MTAPALLPEAPTAPRGAGFRPPRRPFRALALLGALLAGVLRVAALDRDLGIAVYQGPSAEGDFEANVATARALVTQARLRGCGFLALPAGFLTGAGSAEIVRTAARGIQDPAVRAFIAETASHDVVVLAGLVRVQGGSRFKSTLVVHRGRLLGVQDQVILTPQERETLGLSAGMDTPVFAAHGVRFGVVSGPDTEAPHLALAARLQGAELLFVCGDEPPAGSERAEALRVERTRAAGMATLLGVAVARSGLLPRPGDGAPRAAPGSAFILDPRGTTLAESGTAGPELAAATLGSAHFRAPTSSDAIDRAPAWLRARTAALLTGFRRPGSDDDLRRWLENMLLHHRYSVAEASAATGLTPAEVESAARRFGLAAGADAPAPTPGGRLRVLPYPGGRHPRLGFFDGAVDPQRETKVSVFPPWAGGGYVVVDVPEAIFSNLGLLYLAHTHVPTVAEQRGWILPRLEWTAQPDGVLASERSLPNGVRFGTRVMPEAGGVRFELWLRNDSPEALTGLRVQNCVMLGYATGFEAQTVSNKRFETPMAVARSGGGRRWILTLWERCGRTWGNELVPCLHSDPVFEDCPPGETRRLRGWLSFYEGDRPDEEIARVRAVSGIP